jgi:DNA-binding transcriptional regulator YhcF (GntR family)
MTEPPQLSVASTDPTPPYEQVRRQLAALIGDGVLPPGERLPPLRQLAGDLGLAVGTVARAYRELEAAGLVVGRRGGGTRVAAQPTHPAPQHPAPAGELAGTTSQLAGDEAALLRAAADYVRRARAAGADHPTIVAALHRALDAPTA